MSVFSLPKGLCNDINFLMQKFWWGHQENESQIHWMSWGKMGVAKSKGGLGFRDLVIFNKALSAKQGWLLLMSPESITVRIIKANYYPNCSILKAPVGKKTVLCLA